MKAQLSEIMYNITSETFEKMAFIFAEQNPEPGADETAFSGATVASVSFTGPTGGSLCMAISGEVLPELSANMLGMDEDETTSEQHADALRETMNVICGNLLPAIAGDKAVFDIDAPEIIVTSYSESYGGKQHVARARLEMDEGFCEMFLFIDDTTCLEI